MIVTIFTDASFCSSTGAAGWAAWIKFGKAEGETQRFYGQIHQHCGTSTGAEMAAAANALFVATRALTLTPEDRIILATDCMAIVDILNGKPNRALGKAFFKNCKTVVDSALACGVRLEARHVKGHSKGDGARSAVNDWCDRAAKQQMLLLRAIRMDRRAKKLARKAALLAEAEQVTA